MKRANLGWALLLVLAACGGDDDDGDDGQYAGLAHDHADHLTQEDLDNFVAGDHDHTGYIKQGEKDAITGEMIKDDEVSDDDVATDAAIAGSKIVPDFGDQDLSTLGTLSIGAAATTNTRALFNESGSATQSMYGGIGRPTVVVENPDGAGSTDPKYPSFVVSNYGAGHPFVLQVAARGTRDAPEALDAGTFAAWVGRAYDGKTHLEGGRISFYAEDAFSDGHNPTTMRFELGDDDPQTPGKVTRVIIKANGNVGIGTPSPQATLDVNGYARLKVQNAEPVACSATTDGSIALTSTYQMCACKGAASQWVYTHNGSNCVF